MKYLSLMANLLVGLTYTIFGLNGFFHFIQLPEMNADAGAFVGVLMSTGFFSVIKVMQIVIGLCILIGYQRPLMHVLIAPITLSIVLFELLISKQPGVGLLLAMLSSYMFFVYRERYFPIVAKA